MKPLTRRTIHDDVSYWLKLLGSRIKIPDPIRLKYPLLFLACGVVSLITIFLVQDALPQEATLMAGIFTFAALLWATEALPLFATSLLIIGLEILLLANPGDWPGLGFETAENPDYRVFLAPLADPVIILFLGGFLMAKSALKEGVDTVLANIVLHMFRGRPMLIILGLMIFTAVFSMFMSNTATTAMMITLVLPIVADLDKDDRLRKGLVLSIPFAANIGGLGTPIASPPNAVASGYLINAGYEISFLGWMAAALPFMIGLLLITWLMLAAFFRTSTKKIEIKETHNKITHRGILVMFIFALTVGLWLTDSLHGLPASVVALIPAIGLTTTGLLGRKDYNSLEWHILTLIAGGIALGVGMSMTGLDQTLIDLMPLEGDLVLGSLLVLTIVMSTFMSNTAAANLLLPIGISFAVSASALGLSPIHAGVAIAMAASLAMGLPVSTPPNAIAYAHGILETRDIAIPGVIIGAIGLVLIYLFSGILIEWVV